MPLIVTFATQPVYNTGRAAHALRSDQFIPIVTIYAATPVLIYNLQEKDAIDGNIISLEAILR